MDYPVKIQLLHPDAVVPAKAHDTDACFDVVAVSILVTEDYIEYGLGFATEIPEGWQGLIYPRSSISKYDLALCNGVAVIDADYRGEWKVRFKRTPREYKVPVGGWRAGALQAYTLDVSLGPHRYMKYDKIAQIQFQRVPTVAFQVVDSLPDTQRGAGGFGSSGV